MTNPSPDEGIAGLIERDEARFRYFYPQKKIVLPPNFEGRLTVITTYELVRARQGADHGG